MSVGEPSRRAGPPGRRPGARRPDPPRGRSPTGRSARRSAHCCRSRSSAGTWLRAPPPPARRGWGSVVRNRGGRRRGRAGPACGRAARARARRAWARPARGRTGTGRGRCPPRSGRAGDEDAGHPQGLEHRGLHPGLQGRAGGLLEALTQDLDAAVGVDATRARGGQALVGVGGDPRGVGQQVPDGRAVGSGCARRGIQVQQPPVDGDQGGPGDDRLGDRGEGEDLIDVAGLVEHAAVGSGCTGDHECGREGEVGHGRQRRGLRLRGVRGGHRSSSPGWSLDAGGRAPPRSYLTPRGLSPRCRPQGVRYGRERRPPRTGSGPTAHDAPCACESS